MSSTALGEIALALSNATVFPDVVTNDIVLGVTGSSNAIRLGGASGQPSVVQIAVPTPGLRWSRYDNSTTWDIGANFSWFNTATPSATGVVFDTDSGFTPYGAGSSPTNVSIKLMGYFVPNVDGIWTFYYGTDDVGMMWLGASALAPTNANYLAYTVYQWGYAAFTTPFLTKGQAYPLLAYYKGLGNPNNFRMGFKAPSGAVQSNGFAGFYTHDDSASMSVTGSLMTASNVTLSGALTSTSNLVASNIVVTGAVQKSGVTYGSQFTSSNSFVYVMSGSNVGIRTTTPAVALDVTGTINASSAVTVGGASVSNVYAPLGTSNAAVFASNVAVAAGNAFTAAAATDWQPVTCTARALVVGGGGGGGGNGGGGGGGGGFVSQPVVQFTSGNTYTVTVGAGGSGTYATTPLVAGSSALSGAGVSISALGGGGGASRVGGSGAGATGGSGGGGGGWSDPYNIAGSGTPGQGNSGGNSSGDQAGNSAGGGGGGAGSAGAVGATLLGGNGGAGLSSPISGSEVYYAGGGGGGCTYNTGTPGTAGTGGGGAGWGLTSGAAGTANTGGGGGGGGQGGTGSAGGTGVVIISMPTANYAGAQYTGTVTVTTSGVNTILTFTTSGTLVFVNAAYSLLSNIGIGTLYPTPGCALDVAGGPVHLRNGATYFNFTSNQMLFGYSNSASLRHGVNTRHNAAGGVGNAIDIVVWDSNLAANAVGTVPNLTLTPVGVGVNNSNPQFPLDVSGTGNFAGNVKVGNATIGDCGLGAASAAFAHSNLFTGTSYALAHTSAGATTVNCQTGTGVVLGNNAARQANWTTTGLGLGTQTPAHKLDVYGNARIANLVSNHMGLVLGNSCNALAVVEQQSANLTQPNETILNIGQNTGNVVAFPTPTADSAYFQIDTRAAQRRFNWFGGWSNTASNVMTLTYPSGGLYVLGNVYTSNAGLAVPSVGVRGGTGDKLILSPGTVSTYPSSIGMAGWTMWHSVPTASKFEWYTAGASAVMTLNSTMLGIGVTPTKTLDISAAPVLLRNGNTSNSFGSNQILFGYSNSTSVTHAINSRHAPGGGCSNAIDVMLWNSNTAAGALVNTAALSVTAAGVGINNTTAPQYPLDVDGKARITGGIYGPTAGALLMRVYDESLGTYDFRGRVIDYQTITTVNMTNATYGGATVWSLRIAGYIIPPQTDLYTFQAQTDDGCRMWINDVKHVDSWITNADVTYSSPTSVALNGGQAYPIIIEHYNGAASEHLVVRWKGTTYNTGYQTLTHGTGATAMQLSYDLWDSAQSTRFSRQIVSGNLDAGGALTSGLYINRNYLLSGTVASGGPTMYLDFASGGTDASGNGYTATLAGTYSTASTTTTLNGKTVNYLTITNTGSTALTTALNPTAGAKTISFWVNTTRAYNATDSFYIGFSAGTVGNNFSMLFHPIYYDLWCWGYGNDWAIGSGTTQWANTGTWKHVALTMDITNMVQVFVDGVPVGKYYSTGSLDYSTTATTVTTPKIRFNATTTTSTFKITTESTRTGIVYNYRSVLYYNRTLTHGEINALYYNT